MSSIDNGFHLAFKMKKKEKSKPQKKIALCRQKFKVTLL